MNRSQRQELGCLFSILILIIVIPIIIALPIIFPILLIASLLFNYNGTEENATWTLISIIVVVVFTALYYLG